MARRVLKAVPSSQAGIEIGESSVRVSGGRESFVYAETDGLYLVGKLSILAQPEDIRIGASWTLPTAYEAALPSTAVNPQPILVPNSPVEGFSSVAEEVARLLGELM
jgi:hypothetical protein